MPQQPSEIDKLLVDYTNRRLDEEADRQSVPRDFVRRIAGAESTNRPDVISGRRRSSAGAIGKMQLMPGTARDLGVDPDNVDDNIRGGVAYAKQQLDAFGGDWEKAAAAYNAGPGAVKKYGGVPPYKETQDYVRKVAGSEQSASEIDRLYERFVGQQPSATPQYDEQGRRKIGARDVGITPAEGMRFDLSGGASRTAPKPAPQIPVGQRKLRSVGPRVGLQPAPGSFEEARANVSRLTSQISPETQERLRKIEEFERQPITTQLAEQARTYLASGGGEALRSLRRAVGAGFGAVQALQGGKLENVDIRSEALRKWEEERQRELAEEKQRYRPTLANEVAQGVIEGAPVAALGILAGAATGGGVIPTMATGAGLSAVGADWNDPERAAVQTALGAVAPVAGGKLGSAVAGRAAAALASPAARAAANIAGEIGGGAAGNVLQSAAEQAAFEGEVDPRELAKQATIGAALSAPGALSAASGARYPERGVAEPLRSLRNVASAPEAARGEPAPQPAKPRSFAESGRRLVEEEAPKAEQQEPPAVIHRNPEIDRKPVLAQTQDGRVIVENPNNKSGVSIVKDRGDQPAEHKFSSTQMDLPKDVADEIAAFGRRIPDQDLADNGREDTPHITIKYGLHGWDPKFAEEALKGEGPITVKFGKVSVFHNDDDDVVKVDVESPDLHRLNQKVAESQPQTETHPTYEPHATIAYVRKGQGAKYAGDNFLEGRTVTLDRLTFSGRDGRQVEIPIGGRKARAEANAAQVAGEPVSPRWLNAQRRQAAELLGLDPDQIPVIEEQAPEAALQNLQTRPAGVEGQPAAAEAAFSSDVVATAAAPESANSPKPRFVADAEQRLSDAASGKLAGSGGQQLLDMAIVTGWKSYKAGIGFIEWSREVIKQAGESVRPHLQRVWRDLTENFSVGPLPRTRADVERSPQFQRFFRDSKVVDEQGGPMVVYHGTPNSFDTFDPAKIKQGGSLGPGVYIAENPHTASQYVSGYNVGEDAGKSPNIMPLYLSMQKPLDVEGPLLDRAKVARLIPENADDLPDTDKVSYFEVIDAVGDKRSQDVAKRLGYDGLVMNLDSGRVWLAFEPTQIKSATGNRGDFDPSSGSILGSGLGSLQPLFERPGRDKSSRTSQSAEPVSRRGRVFEDIGAAQTVAQLGSPGFVIRNVLQHASHGAQELVTQGLAGLIDKAVSSVTGKRTIGGFGSPIEAAREVGRFIEDYKTGVSEARGAIKRGESLPGSRLRDMPDPETLTAVGRRLSKVLTWINEVPDAGNWNAHFQRSMRDQARATRRGGKASADESLSRVDQMIERAWAEADHASLRDKNFVSKSLGALKKGLNTLSSPITGTDKFGLGDFVIKYTGVPGALVKRSIEYSPLGVIEGGYHAIKGDQRKAIQSLARAVTGSASGSGVGAMLAAYGILVGPEHDAGQAEAIEREEGRRGYSLNLSALKRLAAGGWDDPDESGKLQAGDQLIGIDWLQPWALQASTGAAIYQAAKRGELKASGVAGAAADSLGQWLSVADDQTVLKNVRAAIPYRSKDDTLWDTTRKALSPILTGAPASFVPSLARQARQVADPFVRDTRPEQPKGLRAGLEEAKNKVKEGLPGLSETLPTRPSVLTGEPKKTAIGDYSLPARSLRMVSPAPFTTYEPSPIAREADRLRDAGHKIAFELPGRAKQKAGQPPEPTGLLRRREEQFATTFAEAARRMIEHPDYQVAEDLVKARSINNLAKYLRERTRKKLEDRTIEEIVERAGSGIADRESK